MKRITEAEKRAIWKAVETLAKVADMTLGEAFKFIMDLREKAERERK